MPPVAAPVVLAGSGRGQLSGPCRAEAQTEGAEPGGGEGAQSPGEGGEAAGEAEEEGPGAAAELRGGGGGGRRAPRPLPLPTATPPPQGTSGPGMGHAMAKGPRCQAEMGTERHGCPPRLHPCTPQAQTGPRRGPLFRMQTARWTSPLHLIPPPAPHRTRATPPHPKGSGGGSLPPLVHPSAPAVVRHQPRTVHGLTPPRHTSPLGVR